MPRGRARVLEQLLLRPERELYLRELAARAGISLSSAQRELARLTAAGLLLRRDRGRQTFYRANTRSPVFADLRSLLLKTVGVAGALRAALSGAPISLALIYGSLATGEDRAGSDVDVLVVGAARPRAVSDLLGRVERRLGREINSVVLDAGEFRRRLREGDRFLCDVMAGPKIMLVGDEDEARRLAQ